MDLVATITAGLFHEPRGLFVLLALIVCILYGISVGKTKALVSLLSIYVAYVLTVLFPFLDHVLRWIPGNIQDSGKALLFLALYITAFLLLSHAMARGRLTLGEISLVKVVIISIVQLGLIASMTLSLLPEEFATREFGPFKLLVAGAYALWGWAAGSLIILPFMRVRRRS
jgi:hypothetical protein